MGCDIHPTVQWLEYPARNGHADYWSSLSWEPMSWGRDYTLFSRIAGVRCQVDHKTYPCPCAVVAPRGYPDGFSVGDRNHDDLHTPTWLTLDELKKAAGGDSMADVYATIAAMEEFERRGFKTRIVFAFDN
jgi:hypothetical protein